MVHLKRLAGLVLAAAALIAPAAAFGQAPGLPAAQEITPKGPLPDVPRNQTLILGWGVAGGTSVGTTNPWVLPGYTHQEGNNLLFEPLMYFAIFKGEFVPWLADSMEYTTPDFKTLEIKLNKDATWSDGKPVTSKDVVYTFEGQM
ncbi:ABC transporter substrate-binding protein, partial [Inquilinus sp.]|uniref:ABC transporter substrate-binding protein n=1 Tax=Inquilinus sp. TaxID=1932117 RepID=UPI00378328F7